MKNIMKVVKELKLQGICMLLVMIESVISISVAISSKLISQMYDAISSNDMHLSIVLAISSMALLTGSKVTDVISSFFKKKASYAKDSDIRLRIFDKAINADVPVLQDTSLNEVINIGTKYIIFDVLNNISFIGMVIFDALSAGYIMITTNITLATIIGILLLLVILINFYIGKKFIKMCNEREKFNVKMISRYNRARNFSIIKSFCRERYELEEMQKDSEALRDASVNKQKYVFIMSASMRVLYCVLTAIIYGYAIYSHMKVSNIILFKMMLDTVYGLAMNFTNIIDDISETVAEVNRLCKVLEIEDEKDGTIELDKFDSKIEFKDVSFSYKKSEKVLHDINLTINKGEKVGIYGPSGQGKSTFINLINRFFRPDGGSISIDTIDINDLTKESLRSKIGIVSQDIYLFDGSIEENIRYGNLRASKEDIIEAAKKANAYEFICQFKDGFDTNIGRDGIKLSGGQKQRISIARMILANPDIIILDEATSKLDNESEKIVQEAIDNVQGGKTVISIAHRLSTLDNCDYLIGINNHSICEQGTKAELSNDKNSLYYKLSNM